MQLLQPMQRRWSTHQTSIVALNRPLWANAGAGRILALPTGHRRRYVTAFHHPDTRREMVRRQGGDILRLLVRHRAGHFAGTTADAPLGIGNRNWFILCSLGIKPQGARISPARALILNGISAVFCQMAGRMWSFA